MSLTFEGDGTISGFDAGLSGFGGLVAVKHAIFTGTQTASVAAGGNVAITDLSITHDVADAANKLNITASIGAAGSAGAVGNVGIGVFDGSNFIGVGTTAGSRTSVSAGGFAGAAAFTKVVAMLSTTFVHVPGAGSKTYTVRALCIVTTTRSISINRMQDDSDSANSSRAISSLVIQEVSV